MNDFLPRQGDAPAPEQRCHRWEGRPVSVVPVEGSGAQLGWSQSVEAWNSASILILERSLIVLAAFLQHFQPLPRGKPPRWVSLRRALPPFFAH